MRNLFIILLINLFIISFNLNAKNIDAEYRFNSLECDISFSIQLYNDGKYEFILNNQFTNDILTCTSISAGNYLCNDKTIILFDNYFKFKMIFSYNDKNLIGIQTFYLLVNKKFTYRGHANKDKKVVYRKNIKSINRNRILENKSKNKMNYNLYVGTYLGRIVDDEYCLKLTKYKSFTYSYDGFILLQGSFKRLKNELILNDSSLEHSFVFFIYDNDIIENFVSPFDNIYLKFTGKRGQL